MIEVRRYKPLTLPELAALQLPEREAVIEGMLYAGSVTLFSAREKSGKTLIATDAGCAIALGEPFLDRAVRQGPVIFVALEENIREVRERILVRLGGRTDHAGIPLFVLPANGFGDDVFRLDDPACLDGFAAMVAEYEPRAVFIDTFREAHALREDVADDMAPLIRPVRQIAHEANSTISLIHHHNKSGAARGSTAITAAVDQLWSFQRTDADPDRPSVDGATGRLVVEGRFGPRQAFGMRLGEGLRWELDGALLVPEAPVRDRVLAHLRSQGDGATAEAIADGMESKLKTVQNELSRLLQERPSPIVASGTGRRNAPRTFRVVDPALWPDDDEREALIPDSQTLGDGAWESIVDVSSQPSGSNGNHPGNGSRFVPERVAPTGVAVGNKPAGLPAECVAPSVCPVLGACERHGAGLSCRVEVAP